MVLCMFLQELKSLDLRQIYSSMQLFMDEQKMRENVRTKFGQVLREKVRHGYHHSLSCTTSLPLHVIIQRINK